MTFLCFSKRVGCDRVLGSTAVPDACGVCKGDNSTCKIYKGQYTKQHYTNRTTYSRFYSKDLQHAWTFFALSQSITEWSPSQWGLEVYVWWNWTHPAPTWLSGMHSDATIWTDIGQWTGQAGMSSPEPFLSTRGRITDQRASYQPVPPTRHLSLRWLIILTSSWFFHDTLYLFNIFLFFCRCCCKAGTQGYTGNTPWKKLMRRGGTIIHGPLYAPSAQQPVQEVRLLSLKESNVWVGCGGWK